MVVRLQIPSQYWCFLFRVWLLMLIPPEFVKGIVLCSQLREPMITVGVQEIYLVNLSKFGPRKQQHIRLRDTTSLAAKTPLP